MHSPTFTPIPEGVSEPTYTISLNEWLNDSSLSEGSRINRKGMVANVERITKRSMERTLADIQAGRIATYNVAKQFLDTMRSEDYSTQTIFLQRSLLFGMFQSVVGEERCRRTIYNRLVPIGATYNSRNKKVPTIEEIQRLLKISNPLYRALLAVLAVSGMRIGEVLSRKQSDIEVRNEGYGVVRLLASETKARYQRFAFLTKEVLGMIAEYHSWLPESKRSEYIFPNVQYGSVRLQIKRLYARIGLKDSKDQTTVYCIHSLRTFAGDYMRRLGLSEKYVLATIGHKAQLASESHYLNWEEIERSWKEHCSERMSFLTSSTVELVEQKEKVERLESRNGKLELLLEKLLERLTD